MDLSEHLALEGVTGKREDPFSSKKQRHLLAGRAVSIAPFFVYLPVMLESMVHDLQKFWIREFTSALSFFFR